MARRMLRGAQPLRVTQRVLRAAHPPRMRRVVRPRKTPPGPRVLSPLASGRNNVRELRAQRRHVLGDGGRGSILTASPFSYSSTIGVPAANCCLLIKTWCMVPVPGIVRGKRGLRIRVRKKRNVCFYMEPRLRFYTRTRKFNNEVTNRRGKKDSFLNLTKSCIINGLTL